MASRVYTHAHLQTKVIIRIQARVPGLKMGKRASNAI